MQILDAEATALALPWPELIRAIRATLADHRAGGVHCPPRVALPITDEDLWLMMPAWSRGADVAACKLITVHAGNPARGLPMIQGDVIAIRASTGERIALLDGPTVTGRRTAAVTVLAIQDLLATRVAAAATIPGQLPHPAPLTCLIVGCGVQGRSHLDALARTVPLGRVYLHSRSAESARRLAAAACADGIAAEAIDDVRSVVGHCELIVCCTPANRICLPIAPREGTLIAAIGAFTPTMAEIAPDVVRSVGRNILLDTPDAAHEAGDLLLAGVAPQGLPSLLDAPDTRPIDPARTVLFKSCGSALWDLAAAQVVASGGAAELRRPDC